MVRNLDPRLSVGARVGEFVVIAAIPHATLSRTWAMTGLRDDGTYAAWAVHLVGLETGPRVFEFLAGLPSAVDAITEMLRRARAPIM
jgi:hypothetical protein